MAYQVVILGAGESGTGAAVLAVKKGLSAFVSDKGNISEHYRQILDRFEIPYEEGQHTEKIVLSASEIIKSPGIPDEAEIVVKARQKGIPVISEIEFAARYTRATKLCITGSNGKTTTTLLLYHILKNSGLDVGLGGNVGHSMAMLLSERDYPYLVLEISSFQLDGMYDFRAEVAILTNITPDHLDRYGGSFDRYAASKFRIIRNQKPGDAFIYCADDPKTNELLDKFPTPATYLPFTLQGNKLTNGAYLQTNPDNFLESKIIFHIKSETMAMTLNELVLTGKHNIYNTMAAGIAARWIDIRKPLIRQSLSSFQGVEHRLEYVATVRGIDFINDSKATNVNSVWWALDSATKPVIWIAGGLDKGNNYQEIADLVRTKVKAIICIGVDNSKIIQQLGKLVKLCLEVDNMEDAVQMAYQLGEKGDMVLLSPGCASFDRFKNYEDRGNQFKKAVINL